MYEKYNESNTNIDEIIHSWHYCQQTLINLNLTET